MSSFHFPIILGRDRSERVVIIHLIDGEEDYVENRVVITSEGNGKTPLFKIPKEAGLIDEIGTVNTYDIKDIKIECESLDIKIERKEKDDFYDYYINTSKFDNKIIFTASIADVGDCVGSLHIVRPTLNDIILKINADLGSDATQVNYYSGGGIQSVPLVSRFKESYNSTREYGKLRNPENGDPLFTQEEKWNDAFYKTGNITFNNNGDIQKDITDSSSFINYLNVSAAGKNEPQNSGKGSSTWEEEINYKKKLINIKLLYAHNTIDAVRHSVRDIQYSKYGRKRSVINTDHLIEVLRAIYKQIITTSTANIDSDCKYFSVMLLVPNIYIQKNIDYLLYEMNKLNNNDKGIKYDFRIISESDSAFVGIKEVRRRGATQSILGRILNNVKDPRQKDMFLIIDAGKGTTDYSIIKYDTSEDNYANNEMVSIRREGIVGAGGAIDYVFARVFARQIYNNQDKIGVTIDSHVSKEEFTNRFMTLIERLSPVDQDKMMQLVETLKKSYADEKTANLYACFKNDEISGIISSLGQIKIEDYTPIRDDAEAWKALSRWTWDNRSKVDVDEQDKKEINWVCDAIAETIIDKMIFEKGNDDSLMKQIDYVIFNGRSFHFEPLKRAFINKIEPHRGIWWTNYSLLNFPYWYKFKTWLTQKRLIKGKTDKVKDNKYKNLKVAQLDGYNMKAVSVLFSDHNLGVNCNSDLCCMDRLNMVGSNNTFNQNCFWKGFIANDEHNASTHYYIGYKNHSFVPPLDQMGNGEYITSKREKLIHMTLYPVNYIPIGFNDDETNHTTQTSNVHNSNTPENHGLDNLNTSGPEAPDIFD